MTDALAAPLQGPVVLSLPFSTTSAAEVRRALVSWLLHHGSSQTVIADAELIATELVANALRHASPLDNGTMLVRWRLEGSELLLSVCDGGGTTEPTRVELDPDSESGRGLAIVEALAARWRTERTRRVHAVHVHLPLG